MNEHAQISDLLPLYVSGALNRDQRSAVAAHLARCTECQADLALWKAAAKEIVRNDMAVAAPIRLAEQALEQVRRPRKPSAGAPVFTLQSKLLRAALLVRSQAPLVQREIWPASAAVIGLGTIAALLAVQSGVIYALAPLVAAACVALIYGPENDPAYELALSTPTSPRQVMLARLVLVFGYNLGLILVATLGLLPAFPQSLLGDLALAWLAPMTFLSASALVLSLWIGASNAISITYAAWLAQLFAGLQRSPNAALQLSPAVLDIMAVYQNFWQSPALLLSLAALLFALAVWLVGRPEPGKLNPA